MTTWTKNTQLGPYALISPIGTGRMGEVWKARDTRLNRIVAVKRLKEEHRKRFEHEARSIAALESSAAENQCPWVDLRHRQWPLA